MRAIRYVFLLLAIILAVDGLVITFGILTGELMYFLVATWLTFFVVLGSLLLLIRAYQRIVSRLGTAKQRLGELHFLQERRYDQLRTRIDYLADSSRTLHKIAQDLQASLNNQHRLSLASQTFEELESLNARLQRAERRILGKLENELFEMYQSEQGIPLSGYEGEGA